jgi:hypothetical protein
LIYINQKEQGLRSKLTEPFPDAEGAQFGGNPASGQEFLKRGIMMNTKPAVVLLSGLLFACAPPPPAAPPAPPPAPAPATAPVTQGTSVDRFVTIQRATCDAFLTLSDDDRAAAAMFYMGYQASRARAAAVNVGMIPTNIGLATDLCAAEPNRTVASVFAEAYAETRRW